MGTVVTWLGGLAVPLYVALWIGVPMIVVDWYRKRRQETIRRQIALTDAIDGQFGPMVAPVVKKPLWRPWQVQIAVPFGRPGVVGKILAVAHEVLSDAEVMKQDRYEIVLSPKQGSMHDGGLTRTGRPVGQMA